VISGGVLCTLPVTRVQSPARRCQCCYDAMTAATVHWCKAACMPEFETSDRQLVLLTNRVREICHMSVVSAHVYGSQS
jgi:hypothetical protein